MMQSQATQAQAYENIQALIRRLSEFFSSGEFRSEFQKAQTQFFHSTAVFEEGDSQYHLRLAQFFDWFLGSRKLDGFQTRPLEAVPLIRELRLHSAEEESLGLLKKQRHGLFEVLKKKGNDLIVYDLFRKEKLIVRDPLRSSGLEKDQIFEARLIPFGETWFFLEGMCFHPSDANKYLLKKVKQHQKNPDLILEDFLFELIRRRYQWERYKHASVDQFYTDKTSEVMVAKI